MKCHFQAMVPCLTTFLPMIFAAVLIVAHASASATDLVGFLFRLLSGLNPVILIASVGDIRSNWPGLRRRKERSISIFSTGEYSRYYNIVHCLILSLSLHLALFMMNSIFIIGIQKTLIEFSGPLRKQSAASAMRSKV